MQPVNRNLSAISSTVWSMQVAFASTDFHHVDQHFGATPRLVIYGVKQHEVTLLKVVDFTVEYGHRMDKLASRINALDECVQLYCVALGETVFRQLLQVGVRAIRVEPATPIALLLQQIQQCWAENQQRTHRRQRDPDRFQQLLAEQEWHEEDDAV